MAYCLGESSNSRPARFGLAEGSLLGW
jgi:hypothetical protein